MIILGKPITLWILFISFDNAFSEYFPKTTISNGILRGNFWKTKQNRTFSAFTGIPYAEPPIGNLRFKTAIPKEPWNGIFNATKVHPICIQRDIFQRMTSINGVEDCLFLNVYTPKVDFFERDLLPVMVMIHGGGFAVGSANSQDYGPNILLDKDIVLVTLNYRLGPLGFISTGDEVVPGNNGLKDQNLALKWVHKNIKQFGGNTNQITLFGHSAGAACVHYQMLSPLSKGLFHRAIIQSGNALAPWAFGENNQTIKFTKKLAESLNCPIESSTKMVNCLREVNATSIIGQDKIFIKWDYDPIASFRPTIESNNEGAFLIDHPVNIMKTEKCMDIPVITGFARDEGSFKIAGYKSLNLLQDFAQRFDEIAPYSIQYGRIKYNESEVSKAIRKFYFQDKEIKDSIHDISKIYTDSWIVKGIDQFRVLFKQIYTQPLYFYLLAYRGSLSVTKNYQGGDENYGIAHGDDLIYLTTLGYNIRPGWIPTKNDQLMMDLLTTLFTNFAIYGNPTPNVDNITNINWEPYTIENEEYLEIFPSNLKMKEKVFQNRIEFWRTIMKD